MADPFESFRQEIVAMDLSADCGLYVFTKDKVHYFPTIYHAQMYEDHLKGLGHG